MATNPTLLTMPIAENGQKNTIPATQAAAGDGLLSQSTGFPPETALPLGAGGKAPTREDFNGAFNLLSDIAFYTQKGWTFQYDENQAYYKGCIVMDATDGLRYECINDVAAGEILPSADTQNEYWREYSPGGVPLGTILPYAANAAEPPYSFLFCEGQAVSRTMYPDLFALIGTTYGAGDGSTTFNLPNMLNRYPQGDTTAGTVKSAGLPNITGSIQYGGQLGLLATTTESDGAFYADADYPKVREISSASGQSYRARFDASRSNSIYGNSDTVTPPTITVRWIIKAYDAPTPSSAQIDLSQYASDLAARLTREQTPAFNRRDVITTSGTYTAPVTGWYRITLQGGGGGGGGGGKNTSLNAWAGGGGGGQGGHFDFVEYLNAGDTANIVIGAGGSGGAAGTSGTSYAGQNGTYGGDSSVVVNLTTYIAKGGMNGFGQTGANIGNAGTGGDCTKNGTVVSRGMTGSVGNFIGSSGVGLGGIGGGAGGANTQGAGVYGAGGGGGVGRANNDNSAGGAGGAGYAEFSYFDPTLM